VTPGSASDREAQHRGNSVYFPDPCRTVLPEELSADLCSLRASGRPPVLAALIIFDSGGPLKKHRIGARHDAFRRKLTYAEVQDALDGHPTTRRGRCSIRFSAALRLLSRHGRSARQARSLDLDLPEHKIQLAPTVMSRRFSAPAPRDGIA